MAQPEIFVTSSRTPTRALHRRFAVSCLGLLIGLCSLWPMRADDVGSAAPGAEASTEASTEAAGTEAAGTEAAGTEAAGTEAAAEETATEVGGIEPLTPEHETWLKETSLLISAPERRLFDSLTKTYQRQAFINEFWKVRDPYPRTPRNELKERWPLRTSQAMNEYGNLTDDRARVFMVHGKPAGGFKVSCTQTRIPAEVWYYQGTDVINLDLLVVFFQRNQGEEFRIWNPSANRFAMDQVVSRARNCINGQRLTQVMGAIASDIENYEPRLLQLLRKPPPRSQEWLHTFVAHSTEVSPDATTIDGVVTQFAFPGRHQSRTVVQGIIDIPLQELAVGEYADYRSHDLLLIGEVLIEDDTLFESFRYKFGFGEQQAPGSVPLMFQRFLRPGDYTLLLKVEDLNSGHVYHSEQALTVPQADTEFVMPTFKDQRTEQLFAEATSALQAGATNLRLIPPQGSLATGFTRFDSLVSGEEIDKVRYFLDGKQVLIKNRPPWSVQIDLGSYPVLHTLRAEGLDDSGAEVASDEILINGGGYRFALKLVEPRKAKRYQRSLRARAEIEVPDNRSVERVEFFLNERRVATLYQEPWIQPIALPEDENIGYVRAVAYLPDGNSTEDLVFINAPDYLDELEIQFVELYTTVLDRQGRPVNGLTKDGFKILEDEVPQTIARFEQVENLPIHVGIMIDNSASMVGTLGEVRNAALNFFQQAITPRDRAAVITFNSFPHLAVELTNNRAALGSGLAGLTPEGQTALYDSVMFGLYYFAGIKGQRAILVLSDGKDESSRFTFDETLEYARRAGITIYSIGLRLNDGVARGKLNRLADETGGRCFFIRDIQELDAIYTQIQKELRSQYLIAYQSTNTTQDDTYRAVSLELDRPDVEVKTISGYYP